MASKLWTGFTACMAIVASSCSTIDYNASSPHYVSPPTLDAENSGAIAQYAALQTSLRRAKGFRDYLKEEELSNNNITSLGEGLSLLSEAALGGVIFSGAGATALRAVGGVNLFADSFNQLNPGDLRTQLIVSGVTQLDCAIKTADPFVSYVDIGSYRRIFADSQPTAFPASRSSPANNDFDALIARIDSRISLYNRGLAPVTRAAIGEVEMRSESVSTLANIIKPTASEAAPIREELERAAARVTAAREVLSQTDAYQARLGKAQIGLEGYIDKLNDAIRDESNELRPTPADLARAFVGIVSGVQAEKAKAIEAATAAEVVEATEKGGPLADPQSAGVDPLRQKLREERQKLMEASSLLKTSTDDLRALVEQTIGAMTFSEEPIIFNGVAFGQCGLPTLDFFTVSGEMETAIAPGGSVDFIAQVGARDRPSFSITGGSTDSFTVGDATLVAEGARRWSFNVKASDNAKEGDAITLRFTSVNSETKIDRIVKIQGKAAAGQSDDDSTDDNSETDDGPVATPASLGPQFTFNNNSRLVKDVQDFLFNLEGKLEADGEVGEETRKALRRFQSEQSLPANGALDHPTLQAIVQEIADTPSLLAPPNVEDVLNEYQVGALERHLRSIFGAGAQCSSDQKSKRDCILEDGILSLVERKYLLNLRVRYALANPKQKVVSIIGPLNDRAFTALITYKP